MDGELNRAHITPRSLVRFLLFHSTHEGRTVINARMTDQRQRRSATALEATRMKRDVRHAFWTLNGSMTQLERQVDPPDSLHQVR